MTSSDWLRHTDTNSKILFFLYFLWLEVWGYNPKFLAITLPSWWESLTKSVFTLKYNDVERHDVCVLGWGCIWSQYSPRIKFYKLLNLHFDKKEKVFGDSMDSESRRKLSLGLQLLMECYLWLIILDSFSTFWSSGDLFVNIMCLDLEEGRVSHHHLTLAGLGQCPPTSKSQHRWSILVGRGSHQCW